MSKKVFFAVAVAAAVATSSVSQAAVEANSMTTISNFGLNITSGMASSISVNQPPTESHNLSISLETFGATDTSGFQAGLDGPTLFLGAGVAPGPNTFVVPSPTPYVFADSNGGGNILAGNATATTMASIGSSASPGLTGASSATDQLVQIGIAVSDAVSFQFQFDVDLDLTISNTGSDPLLNAVAASSYGVQILGTADDGTTFFYSSNTDPNFDDLSTIIASDGGSEDGSLDGPISSETIDLPAGNYTIQLSQTNNVRLEPAIPEPATIAVWSLLGVGACAARRRRDV